MFIIKHSYVNHDEYGILTMPDVLSVSWNLYLCAVLNEQLVLDFVRLNGFV
jgi:hypothetical protein